MSGLRAMIARVGLAATIMLTSSSLLAQEPPAPSGAAGPVPGDIMALEDRIDQLGPSRQVAEYLKLRKLLLAKGHTDSQVILDRLARKLALANARGGAPNPDYAQRLDFCKQAALIGESYVKQGDSARALVWEQICSNIEPRNQWASVLRNQVHESFENRLNKSLVVYDWSSAGSVLEEWRSLMGDDHAVGEGLATYALTRAKDLNLVLQKEGAEQALAALTGEEGHYPGLEAWKDTRKTVADTLQRAFDGAVAERSVEGAELALGTQSDLAGRFDLDAQLAPIEENRKRLGALVKALQPSPIQRKYGHVRAPSFRLAVGGDYGGVGFQDSGETIEQTLMSPVASFDMRFHGDDEKTLWYGLNVGLLYYSAAESPASASGLLVDLNGLIGRRSGKWSAWVGLGLAFARLDFDGLAIHDVGSGTIVGNLIVGGEYAATKTLTVHADLEYGGSGELSQWGAKIGARYYVTHNFALGLEALAAGINAKDDSTGADVKVRNASVGPTVLIQF